MKNLKSIGPVIALAAVLLRPDLSSAGETIPAEGSRLTPVWELLDLAGQRVSSTGFKDKVVVLDFWATWCPPCRAEIPDLIELQKNYPAQRLAVIGVSVDQSGLKTVRSFAQKMGINYPVLLADNKIVDAFGGIDGLPTIFIINRTGHIVKQHLGFTPRAIIEKEVKVLLVP